MSGLAISDAPRASIPLRFLVASVLWGIFAGAWLGGQDGTSFASRWTPATVVLVHVFTLGVVGNAMLGALTQFLPVAGGSRLACATLVPALHACFNAGLAVFVAAMARVQPAAMPVAAVLLGLPLVAFAAMACVSLWNGGGARWLRGGIGLSMLALAVTAALGVVALLTLAGRMSVELTWLVDVHASTGIVGAVLTLIAVIGSVTLPMLQGTRAPATWWLWAWIVVVAVGLVAGAWLRHAGHHGPLLAVAIAGAWCLAGVSLWLQSTARRRRNPTLVAFWAIGTVALAAAAGCTLWPLPGGVERAMVAGTLALGIGLPFVVVGMMLEIVGFLAWIQLRRIVPRGRQIPGVGRLLPERDKRCVLLVHVVSACALIVAMTQQRGHAVAGLALAMAWLATLAALMRCGWRVRCERRDARADAAPA